MADQENRNPQHSGPQKPGSEQKPGNQPNQPTQYKQQDPSGQPKSPQSEQENTIKRRKSRLKPQGGSNRYQKVPDKHRSDSGFKAARLVTLAAFCDVGELASDSPSAQWLSRSRLH
jgi:hypothetical protein